MLGVEGHSRSLRRVLRRASGLALATLLEGRAEKLRRLLSARVRLSECLGSSVVLMHGLLDGRLFLLLFAFKPIAWLRFLTCLQVAAPPTPHKRRAGAVGLLLIGLRWGSSLCPLRFPHS